MKNIERRHKDPLTQWHQWITIIAVPAGLAIAGWIGVQLFAMHDDVLHIKDDVAVLQKTSDVQGKAISRIWNKLIGATDVGELDKK